MDIYKAIQNLIEERRRLDALIASLEARSRRETHEKSRRGRKSMGPEERAVVSRRMAAYWAARRGRAAEALNGISVAAPPVEQMPAAPPAHLAAAAGIEASL